MEDANAISMKVLNNESAYVFFIEINLINP